MKYQLTRYSTDRLTEWDDLAKREAFTLIGYSIVDNGHGTKAEAQRFAATVKIGEPAVFGPYTFTINKMPLAARQ